MGYIDSRRSDTAVNFCDFCPHGHAQFGIQVRQGLIHEENFGITDNRSPHSYPLALTTRQVGWFTIQQLFQPKDFRRFLNSFVNISLVILAKLESECHIVINSHVRIKGIILENHGDIPIFRSNVIDKILINIELPFCDILKSCNHSQGC